LVKGDAPPTEAQKALMRVMKKLREVKAIEERILRGDPVEQNQRRKAERRQELLDEWQYLTAELEIERENGVTHEFVAVRAGEKLSRLRTEAAKVAESVSHTAIAPVTESLPVAYTTSAGPPKKGRGRKPKKAVAQEEEGDWITVTRDKKAAQTEEEKELLRQAHRERQIQRVRNDTSEVYQQTRDSIRTLCLFSPGECEELEMLIDKVTVDAERGLFKEHTVDLTPMRNKYFFGFAYTYGAQKDFAGARGIEAIWPPEDTSPIPAWIQEKVISRLEARKVVPKGWINSATINDYAPGGCIVSHIDPPHLFDRPIISVSFFSDCNLVFGTTFSFPKEAGNNIEASTPVLVHSCLRGNGTVLKGYSANSITHAIRPCDLPSRRSSIILRRILPTAPVLVHGKIIPLKEHLAGQKKS